MKQEFVSVEEDEGNRDLAATGIKGTGILTNLQLYIFVFCLFLVIVLTLVIVWFACKNPETIKNILV